MNIATAIVIVFAATFVGADMIDMYMEHVKGPLMTCAKQYGATGQTAREVFDQDSAMGLERTTCQRACTMKALGLLKDSKLDQQALDAIVMEVQGDNPDQVAVMKKVVKDCTEKVKSLSDECKMAYSFTECFFDKH